MRSMIRASMLSLGVGAILTLAAGTSSASVTLTYGTAGTGLAGTVNFAQSGSTLTVTLTNTGAAAAQNADALQAVFFKDSNAPTLVAGTANLNSGSNLINTDGTNYAGGTAANGFRFDQGSTISGNSTLSAYNYGISSAGYGVFGNTANELFTNAVAPVPVVDGLDYGIVNGVATPNSLNQNKNPLISNSMVFTLTGFTGTLADISAVRVQYGTALTDTSFNGTPQGPATQVTPEPSTLAMGSMAGLMGLGAMWRKRRSRKDA